MLGRIAKAAVNDESENWYERSKKLLKTLIDEFWDGKVHHQVQGQAC
jgi:hypothetical protein